jgi:NhaC family Na+:H+ antiporter
VKAPERQQRHRKPTLTEALIPLVAMAALLGVGYGWFQYRIEALLIAAATVAGVVGRRLGYSWPEMERGIVAALGPAMPAIFILIAVGAMIATWMAAGTIPMMISYGFHVISPRFFLLSACLICSIASLCTGTSWGTIGTLGVALMGVATGLDVPAGAAAGAIVAGSYFGDKISAFSDQTVLAPAIVGANLFDHILWLLWTTGPAWLLGLIVYTTAGLWSSAAGAPPDVSRLQAAFQGSFQFTGLLLIPPAIVLWFMVARLPAAPGLLLSSVAAGVLAITIQGQTARDVIEVAVTGYHAATGVPDADMLLTRGGMAAMLEVTLLILAAFGFAGIMMRCGLYARVLDLLLGRATRPFHLVGLSMLTAVLTALVTGSSHLSIIVPGQLFAPAFRAAGLAAKNLSRTTEDSGTVVVPLIPWSASGAFVTATLAVPTVEYLPWAVMNYAGMAFALFYAATGVAIAPRVRHDETVRGS